MARISQDDFSGKTDASEHKIIEIDASGKDSIQIPDAQFIANSDISRDGQDLVLETPHGDKLIVQNYFGTEQSPLLEAPDGSILTENLVNSFLNSSPQYAQTSSMTDESPVGAIEEMKGEATVTRVDGTTEPLTLGSPIYKGDVIETSETGAVNILFIDETSMAISNNARMAVDEYQYDPSTESGETNLSVLRGVFVFTSGLIGRDDPDDVLIDTPVGSIGIRGTIIAGNINPGGQSEVTVVEGAIVVKNGIMEKTLSEQYETVKLGGFNDNIQDIGAQPSETIGKTYGSVSDVVPKLFSSINDTAKEEVQHKDVKTETTEDNSEILEDVVEEEIQTEPEQQDSPMDQTILDPLVQDTTLPILQQPLLNTLKEPTNTNSTLLQQPRDIKNFSLDTINPTIFKDLPLQLKAGGSQLFEGKMAGDVVGRFFAEGGALGPKTFTFGNGLTTSSDGQFTLVQLGNVVEIRLVSNAPATGTSVGTGFTVIAIDSAGQQSSISLAAPIVMDAAVNLNSPGGLNYLVQTTGPLSTLKEIGDVNGDGIKDFIRDNGTTVEIIDGANSSVLVNQAGSSIDGIGDIDNDGYYDVVAGDPTTVTGTVYQINGTSSVVTAAGSPIGNAGDQSGYAVAGIGDFNGDGKSDFAIGAPGAGANGTVYLETGGGNPVITGSTAGSGTFIDGIGDINNDGYSDILIGNAAGSTQASIVYGAATGTGATNVVNAGLNIVAGGAAGDINGDGYDDFAISVVNGANVDTYVVYGKSSYGALNLAYLENPNNALKLHHAGASGSAYEISSLGDINGDGFDDINVGTVGGTHYTVYGNLGGNAPYVMDGAPNDGDPTSGIIQATGTGQALVGDGNFNDGNLNNLSMRGGNSNNSFIINNTTFKNIDGGFGIDTIVSDAGSLNFSGVDFERISQIENIEFGLTGSTITLTAENIFNLLKSSDNGSLTIQLGSTAVSGSLIIDAVSPTSTTLSNDIINALQENGNGSTASYTGVDANGNMHFDIGGYNLYIDASLTTTVV